MSEEKVIDAKAPNYRQTLFVAEYLEHGNATRAAEKAGYAHPDVQGPRLLGNVRVKTVIDREQRALMAKTADKGIVVVERLWDEAQNIESPPAVRVRALELLGKVYAVFAPEKVETTVYSGSFLADLDLTEPENLPVLLGEQAKALEFQ